MLTLLSCLSWILFKHYCIKNCGKWYGTSASSLPITPRVSLMVAEEGKDDTKGYFFNKKDVITMWLCNMFFFFSLGLHICICRFQVEWFRAITDTDTDADILTSRASSFTNPRLHVFLVGYYKTFAPVHLIREATHDKPFIESKNNKVVYRDGSTLSS